MAIKVKVGSGTSQVIPNAKEVQARIISILQTPPQSSKLVYAAPYLEVSSGTGYSYGNITDASFYFGGLDFRVRAPQTTTNELSNNQFAFYWKGSKAIVCTVVHGDSGQPVVNGEVKQKFSTTRKSISVAIDTGSNRTVNNKFLTYDVTWSHDFV